MSPLVTKLLLAVSGFAFIAMGLHQHTTAAASVSNQPKTEASPYEGDSEQPVLYDTYDAIDNDCLDEDSYNPNCYYDTANYEDPTEKRRLRFAKRRLRFNKRRLRFNKRRLRFVKRGMDSAYSRESRAPRLRFVRRDYATREMQPSQSPEATVNSKVAVHSRKRRSASEDDTAPEKIRWSFGNNQAVLGDMVLGEELERLLKAGKRSTEKITDKRRSRFSISNAGGTLTDMVLADLEEEMRAYRADLIRRLKAAGKRSVDPSAEKRRFSFSNDKGTLRDMVMAEELRRVRAEREDLKQRLLKAGKRTVE